MRKTQKKFRTDIQALRGFAVLIVLLYHAKIGSLSAGFLGVDVFFVISGFLITGLVRDSIERGDFKFSDFYFRRAKRLLPAAYTTFLITALAAPFFLASNEMYDFRAQMTGAVTFTSNFTLWDQSGYFEGESGLKPFLHVWSLSIEEQYYFILPALMFFIPRRQWKWTAALILLASMALCFFLVHRDPDATFYLLPTRGWEMAIGSVGALLLIGDRLKRFLKILFWPALVALLTLPVVKIANFHPGPDALVICLATLVIVLRQHPLMFRGPLIHGFSKLGDISYSLYLVHWPLFAFLNNSWFGVDNESTPPVEIRFGLLLLSLLLAWALNRFIEEPARRIDVKLNRKTLVRTVAASMLLLVIPMGIISQARATGKDYSEIRHRNYGLDKKCALGDVFIPIAECRTSEQPELLVWGDSYAMHLVPGLVGTGNTGPSIIQATRSACAPLLGISTVSEQKNLASAEACIDFNDSVVDYLAGADSVQTVVLSSPFMSYLDSQGQLLKRNYSDESHGLITAGLTETVASMKQTVDSVRALGKSVVVISPPPSNGFDIGLCLERFDDGLPVFGTESDCQISVESWTETRGPVLEFLSALPLESKVEVIQLGDYLCDEEFCKTFIDDTFIYRDNGHLSYEGSVLLANNMGWVSQILERAN